MGLVSYLLRMDLKRRIRAEIRRIPKGNSHSVLPSLSAEKHRYRPVSKETLLAVHDYVLDINGVNRKRPIKTGVFTELFSLFRERHPEHITISNIPQNLRKLFMGRLLLTDKAIVFECSARNERMLLTQVANVEFHLDGFSIAKRNGPPRFYEVSSPDPKFAAILHLLMSRAE